MPRPARQAWAPATAVINARIAAKGTALLIAEPSYSGRLPRGLDCAGLIEPR